MNYEQLKQAKLFDVAPLTSHLLKQGYLLSLQGKPLINAFGVQPAVFTLYPLHNADSSFSGIPYADANTSESTNTRALSQASIVEIMDFLINNDIIKDEEILHSWNEHIEWYEALDEQLFSASNADFLYPDSYSDCLYDYSDISLIQRFTNLFTSIIDVSFCVSLLDSQTAIINEMLPFIVDELIPVTTWGTDEVSEEEIATLVQKLSVYLAKLFWIYTL